MELPPPRGRIHRGGFFKYVEGETPIMKAEAVKDYLAILCCLIEKHASALYDFVMVGG